MNKLTKRLKLISELVEGQVVADVGCDHGKLTKELFENGKIKFAYISDISKSSLQKAIDLLNNYNYPFEAICCDGLQGFGGKKIDECIIAGMGGFEIMKIIQNSQVVIDKFILSPQHNEIELKKFLCNNSFEITYDLIIFDKGKFYNIIKCKRSKNIVKLDDFNLYFGKQNFKDENSDLNDYVDYKLQKLKNIKCNKTSELEKIKYQISLFERAKKELGYD